jgi:hypothetical protein
VHYFIPGNEPAARVGVSLTVSDRVFDENSTEYGNHWVIEWIELDINNNISAILSYREEFGMWPGTTINTRVAIIGSPRILTTSVVQDDNSPALLNEFSFAPRNGLSVAFFGGIFLDFLSAAVTAQTLMGANITFSPTEKWRLSSFVPREANDENLIAALRSKFNIQ